MSELYTFDDITGILERHKQMLSQPFEEGQVRQKRFLLTTRRLF